MSAKDELSQSLEKLRAARDQIKLKAHLLKLEGKEVKDKLEHHLSTLQAEANKVAESLQSGLDSGELQAHLAAMELEEKFGKLAEAIEKRLLAVKNNAMQTFDESQLQAHLAKLDASDYWKEKKAQLKSVFEKAADKGKETTKGALGKLGEKLQSLASKM